MPSLTFEHSGNRSGGTINGRILIGRKLNHGIVITDPTVSRLHAWIDNKEGVFVLTDAGSRTGTFVNGEAIVRWELQNGDEIRIGPANLVYHEESELPDDAQALDWSSPTAIVQSFNSGILFDCKCGAPLWVKADFAGKKGLCKYCGEPVTVPHLPKPKPAVGKRIRPAVPTIARIKCGVCHSDIEPGEDASTCVDCHTQYHADCWMENYGCSTYGCAQVNALKPVEEAPAIEAPPAAIEPREPEPATPWELLLLAGSLIGSLIGSLMFGVPAIAVAVGASIVLVNGKDKKRGILTAAIFLSVVGAVVGMAISDFMYFDGRHLPSFWQ
jgi:hypothetical protein